MVLLIPKIHFWGQSMKNNIDFIIHVGAGKTGSTSIQQYLKSNFNELKDSSVLYAGLLFNTLELDQEWKNNPWIFNESSPADKLIKEAEVYADYAKSNKINTIILSNESFCNRIDLLLPFFSYLKEHYSLNIIYYVRDVYKWSISAYKQWNIKHKTYNGNILAFEDYLKTKPYTILSDVIELLNDTDFKENLIIRNFDSLEGGDVTFDFLSAIGLEKNKGLRTNEGLSIYDMPVYYFNNNLSESPILPTEGEEIVKKLDSFSKVSEEYINKVNFSNDIPRDIEKSLNETTKKINVHLSELNQLSTSFTPTKSNYPSIEYLNMVQFAIENHNILRNIDAIKIRDAALLLEDKNIHLSYELMKLAHALRPTGKHILNKLDSYENLIKK